MTILNRLLFNKLPTISPLLVDGKLVSDFCNKANIFGNFVAFICTPIDNASFLPSFPFRTGSWIKSFHTTENVILAVIKTLNPNKAHGCNSISIKIIKICSQSLIWPLKTPNIRISKYSLKKVNFQKYGKKANVVYVHKKEDKLLLKNYCPIVYFWFLEKFWMSNRLFIPSQSGFLPGDPCIFSYINNSWNSNCFW